jgi:hypothetical protein
MKQADKDGNNKISLEEFEVISKKFPSMLRLSRMIDYGVMNPTDILFPNS